MPEKSALWEAFRRGWPQVCETVPKRVKREVEAFLRCGDVRYGFVEVACEDCKTARLVAFSCKGRGWCPSCTTRRSVETGVRVAALLPRVGHRRWTLSLPFTLRFQVVKKPQLLKRLELRLVRAVWRWQRCEARRQGVTVALRGGAVVFTQWFGSMLQLTPHLHVLLPEAQWTGSGEAVEVPPPTDDDVAWRWPMARSGARGPVAESRLRRLEDGRYEYTPKKGVTFIVTADQLVRRLVSLVPPAKTHLTSFHGVYAPHAALRPLVTEPPPTPAPVARVSRKKRHRPSRRLDWASLHRHTFGTDVLRCPCGGRRRILAIHSTRKAAEKRLLQLAHHLAPRRLLPPATAQPDLLAG